MAVTMSASAKLPELKQVSVKQKKVSNEVVLPTINASFQEAVFLPLDVYALEVETPKTDFNFEKTEAGFKQAQEKPPLIFISKLLRKRTRDFI